MDDKSPQDLSKDYQEAYLEQKWERNGHDLSPAEHFLSGYAVAEHRFRDAWDHGYEAGKEAAKKELECQDK